MAKQNIKSTVSDMLADFLMENGLELYNVEFKKEGKERYLRVYVDKLQDGEEEQYVSTDDCETVSRYLSEKLDETDPIKENYYLEVSSPGLDRELITEEHFKRYEGRQVELKLYEAIDGSRNYEGILGSLEDGVLGFATMDGRELQIPREKIAKAKLVVIF